MNNDDPRVIATINKFKEALRDLMLIKDDYYDISVKELCEKAGLSRRTFYLHFSSVDEVLLLIQEEIAVSFLNAAKGNINYRDSRPLVENFFNMLNNNPLYEKIFLKPINDHLRNRIGQFYIAHNSNSNIKVKLDTFTHKCVMITYNNLLTSIYREWAINKKTVSKEEAIDLASNIINHGYRFLYSD